MCDIHHIHHFLQVANNLLYIIQSNPWFPLSLGQILERGVIYELLSLYWTKKIVFSLNCLLLYSSDNFFWVKKNHLNFGNIFIIYDVQSLLRLSSLSSLKLFPAKMTLEVAVGLLAFFFYSHSTWCLIFRS